MKPLLIRDGQLFDPGQGINESWSLFIKDGLISWLGKTRMMPPQLDCDVISARGLVVTPGFIDLHCHLREPGFEEKETIATGSQAAAKGGFTTVCCMPNTLPPLDNRETIEFVQAKAAEEAVLRVLPVGCITRGRKGEELVDMVELASAGVVGFSDDGDTVSNPALMRQALELSRKLGLPVIDHCEDKALSKDGVVNEGTMATQLGLAGIPPAAEENIVARDLELARLTEGRVHIAHVSTSCSVELIRHAKEEGVAVTTEVTPHHLLLTEEEVVNHSTGAKVNPPLRTIRDVEALIEALNDGTIDVIATDHAPHTVAEKALPVAEAPFGISGFETAFGSLMGLVYAEKVSIETLITRLTTAPASILGEKFGKLGTLAFGAVADLVIFDPSKEWVVDPDTFASKGRNTPLTGRTLKGKVVATISRGQLVNKDDSLDLNRPQEELRGRW
ncbi:MAG: dihydroorotase [Dehalococcoidales bacterium]|nr:MAG: dihydroorotase [Dehalococcoidales bacterium]